MTFLWGRDLTVHNSSDQIGASLVAQKVKHLPAMWETQVRSLGWEDSLEKEMAPHSSTLAWEIPWMEEPGRLQSMGLQSQTQLSDFTFTTWQFSHGPCTLSPLWPHPLICWGPLTPSSRRKTEAQRGEPLGQGPRVSQGWPGLEPPAPHDWPPGFWSSQATLSTLPLQVFVFCFVFSLKK